MTWLYNYFVVRKKNFLQPEIFVLVYSCYPGQICLIAALHGGNAIQGGGGLTGVESDESVKGTSDATG